ncbi:Holliday junction branch migration protein RuvA [Caproicibacter sp.]|uniref:Holliday junction branch migration protein RuvA n=1 Tax=Caproicibacter sp. TaxID=2814884 RepID=UPI003988B253
MIYSVKGTLCHTEPGLAVIECGGVGFKCFTSMNTQRTLPQIGEQAKLFTVLNVREDALDLFGFSTQTELSCFKMLTGVSGVGPKVGLAILSQLTPEQVAAAVATGDSKTLTRASGVGPKLAQRICLELRDRVRDLGSPASTAAPAAGVVSASSHASAAVEALSVLGYSPSDAAGLVAQFDSALPVEELIRLSLRTIDTGKQGG